MTFELRIATSVDHDKVNFLVEMINKVYEKSESNIWIDNHNRISKNRLIEIIKSKELLLATNGNDICGCIHLEQVNDDIFKFKMLVANPVYNRRGIGSLLVEFAEQKAMDNNAKIMQLELLVPTEFIHDDKVFLDKWYTRIGYNQVEVHDVDYVHQGISQFLKVGCLAKVYHKKLS